MAEQTNVSPEQIQQAAATGLQLLAQPDLKVPMSMAMGDSLNILNGLLQSLANGSLVVGMPNQIVGDEPPKETEAID